MSSLVDRFIARYGRLPTEVDPDYLEMLQMTKYIILDAPAVSPGKCANCGSSKNDGRKYIDFGLQVDWYGAVYLCGHCLNDIAKAMGLFEVLETSLLNLVAENEKLLKVQDRGVELHALVTETSNAVKEYYDSLSSVGPSSTPDPAPGVELDAGHIKPSTDSAKSRTVKSAPGAGSKNIRSLADLLEDSGD
jgi:hypothetical protein